MTANKSYGPNDEWPRHTLPRMREAYVLARSYGWKLTSRRNHGTYDISCPEGSCSRVVYSTGKGNESFAKSLITLIRRCCHNTALMASLVEVGVLIDDAERLLDAVNQRFVSMRLSSELTKRIEVEEEGGEIENFLLAVEKKEKEALATLAALTATGDPHDAVNDAGEKVSEARASLNELDRENKQVAAAWSRCKELRDQVDDYRRRLESIFP